MDGAGFFALFLAMGGIAMSFLLGPVGQALGRRIAGQAGQPIGPKTGLSTGEMAAERVAGLEQRVGELEERLDFAERMLAQGTGERAALPGSTET